MSINEMILDRVQRGMLFPLIPRAAGSAPRRAMFVSEEIWSLLSTIHDDEEFEERLGILQADLELFAEGQRIDPKYLFLLHPSRDCVWEIRSVRAAPSIRVMCLFAERDVLVATNMALRSDLGRWESQPWKDAKRSARAKWKILFHPYLPLSSTKIGDLVSGAVDGKYFKT